MVNKSTRPSKPTSKALLWVSAGALIATIAITWYCLRERMYVFSPPRPSAEELANAEWLERIENWTPEQRAKAFLTAGHKLTDEEYRQIAMEIEQQRRIAQKDAIEYREISNPQTGAQEARSKWEQSVADLQSQIDTLKSDPGTSGSTDLIEGVERQLERLHADEPLDEVN
jgi:hypothetical protein